MTLKRGVGMDAKSKTCSKCGEEKLLEEFGIRKDYSSGMSGQCKSCRKEYNKQHYQDNKERIRERHKQHYQANKEKAAASWKQYYQDNKEQISERGKQHYQDNKESILKQHKQWRQANKEKIKQWRQANKEKASERARQWRQANKEKTSEYDKQRRQTNREKISEYNKQWKKERRKNDEQYRIRRNLSNGLWYALNKIGKRKNTSILTYAGCTIEFMKEHLSSTKKPDWGDDLHIDHIIPQSLFDHTNEEEIKKCWNWRNLRYLAAEENSSKGNTLDMDLVKSYGIEDLLPEGVDK